MIVHYDEDKRKDLYFTIAVDKNSHIEIIIDQQQPPCGDFKQLATMSDDEFEEISYTHGKDLNYEFVKEWRQTIKEKI